MLFWKLVGLILDENFFIDLRLTKIVKQVKFEGFWSELEARKCFQTQSSRKNLRQAPVFMWNGGLRVRVSFTGVYCWR